jgi:hypothetical protein
LLFALLGIGIPSAIAYGEKIFKIYSQYISGGRYTFRRDLVKALFYLLALLSNLNYLRCAFGNMNRGFPMDFSGRKGD